ncbi:hypothetical protein Vafri_15650, partial [Volvox africanus]
MAHCAAPDSEVPGRSQSPLAVTPATAAPSPGLRHTAVGRASDGSAGIFQIMMTITRASNDDDDDNDDDNDNDNDNDKRSKCLDLSFQRVAGGDRPQSMSQNLATVAIEAAAGDAAAPTTSFT